MNRHSFLSSQPFLFPLPTNIAWPPQISDCVDQCRREIIFREHFLCSIEPMVGSGGPAYFGKSTTDDDPAMCKFAAAIHTVTNKKKPPTSSSSSTPSRSNGTPLGFHQKKKPETDNKESVGFFNIDDQTYQVDLDKIRAVEVKLHNEDRKPPCLLFHFETCIFRIFSIIGNSTDQFSVLIAAKKRIDDLISSDFASHFPANLADIIRSPSTGGSSSEPGQKEYQDSSEKKTSDSAESFGSGRHDDKGDKDECLLVARKCQVYYNACKQNLQVLQKILQVHPRDSKSNRNKTKPPPDGLRDTVSNLLTSVADNMSASFCTQNQLVESDETHNQRISSFHVQVDDILKSVWPNLRPKKRARLSSKQGNSGGEKLDEPKAPPPQRESIAQVKEIMKKYKQALASKYSLTLLPTRG